MRDKERTKWVVIGILTGFVVGCGMNYVGYLILNWLSLWTGMEPVTITFGRLLPLGILMGLSMGAVMMNPPFGD